MNKKKVSIMKTKDKSTRQHIIYGSAMIAIVVTFIFLGNHYVTIIREDYTSQITSLQQRITELQESTQEGLAGKQVQIDSLTSSAASTGEKVQKLEDTTQKLEETTGQYEMQIGELNQQLSDLAVESESFSPVISNVIDSVVSVMTNTGQGSGAIISSDGMVVTNYHVIQGARAASVITYGGSAYGVSLVGYDIQNDIAVLKISSNDTFSYFSFGDSDSLKAGQKVVALGNPAGLSFTATEGIISSPARLASDGFYYIQTDVTLNPGNSGGPIINSRGEIIGIADFKVSGYEGLGFAIPSNRAYAAIQSIISQ
jgi:S1-C subfamily serine protease